MSGLLVTGIQQRVCQQYEQAQSLLQSEAIDRDPEVVHQYRVALRRARSLLLLFESFIPYAKPLSKSLGVQASLCNELRDLDVFLPLLPHGQIKQALESRRERLLSDFLEHIQALKRERELCRFGLSLPWQPGSALFDHEVQQASNVALNEVRVRCDRAIRADRNKNWHQLRLAIKRYRYLLSQCTEQRAPPWVKEWQDLLGTFNDLCCQVTLLKALKQENSAIAGEAKSLHKEWKGKRKAQRARMKALAESQLMKKEASGSSGENNR